MRKRSWTQTQLINAVKEAKSFRQVLKMLGLKEAGGNYFQVQKYVKESAINTDHFKGMGWNKGIKLPYNPRKSLKEILRVNSYFQSFKLKKRLFIAGIKQAKCEICGWAEKSTDGRIPLELDHINGDNLDNRLENLRILCPNCHSLQPTHRGRNKGKNNKKN